MRTVFVHMIFAVASIGITAGAVAASAPAVAATTDGVSSITVQTADLDLSTSAGRSTAKRRIEGAATRVCDNGSRFAGTACRDRAIDDATQSLDQMSDTTQIAAR